MRYHILNLHLGVEREKSYTCEQCGVAFYTKQHVVKHLRSVHLNIRDFVCTTCGKKFKRSSCLKNHEKFVHSNERYKCLFETCEKHFSTPMSRDNHMETHQENYQKPPVHPQEGRVRCNLCGLSFINKHSQQSHLRSIHLNIRDFKCAFCDLEFKSKLALKTHTYKHTGEKPYACQHEGCDRKFRSKSGRIEHNRSHTGEKPFLCTIDGCEQRFRFVCVN